MKSRESHNDSPEAGGFGLTLPAELLRPLVAQIVAEAVAQLQAEQQTLPNKLAFSEEEAARLLSLEPHVLRDERRRGRITTSQIVGRRIRYTRQDLLNYLASRRASSNE